MIDLRINKEGLAHNIQKAKENNIIIPTIAQMQNPDLIPEKIKAKLTKTGLWDVDPVNLFRISWHNEAKESGGLFQHVPNHVEIPSKLSGDHRHAGLRVQRQGDLRQDVGAEAGSVHDDLQPVRRDGQPPLAL